jgi:arginyl-tRNA synthetase
MSVDIKAGIAELLSECVELPAETLRPLLERPPDDEFGDFALPCFTLSKSLHRRPNDIAAALERGIETRGTRKGLISRAEAKGPYLNIFLDRPAATAQILSSLFETSLQSLGNGKAERTVVIDYSSPNIAKPFGIQHIRSTVIGNALSKVYRFLGYRVIGINHLGDWGTQFGKLITAFKHWGDEAELSTGDPIQYLYRLYVRFHKEAEGDQDLEDEARAWFSRLESGDAEAERLWKLFRDLSLDEFRRVYARLGVRFDYYTGESFYSSHLGKTISRIEQSGVTEMSDGALIVQLDDPELPPALLRKSDGSTLYLTRDLAAAFYRYEHYQFDLALYVVGTPQTLHFRQLFKVLEKLGLPWWDRCRHVPFGQIRFEDGSMKTRDGNVIFLEEVLDRSVQLALETILEKNPNLNDRERVAEAVGVGAVIFNDLKNYRTRDINFEWDEVINFNGETGVYLQYTHARACSLLKKYVDSYGAVEHRDGIAAGEEGYGICMLLNDFEETVRRAAVEFEPSIIARYLLDLAAEFNSFYNRYRVISDDTAQSQFRALIVWDVRKVMGKGLDLLGIEAVEEM